MQITPTQLRQNLYHALDQVIETGIPLEVARKGRILRIVLDEPHDKLQNLKPRDYLLTDPDELVHLDWSSEWRP